MGDETGAAPGRDGLADGSDCETNERTSRYGAREDMCS